MRVWELASSATLHPRRLSVKKENGDERWESAEPPKAWRETIKKLLGAPGLTTRSNVRY